METLSTALLGFVTELTQWNYRANCAALQAYLEASPQALLIRKVLLNHLSIMRPSRYDHIAHLDIWALAFCASLHGLPSCCRHSFRCRHSLI